ncbi:MAG: Endonuclease/exonuclease/phosphatase [Monoraphidium minutum]|nr:MAG: Endonuclease/exonuclease/phosphatase [Monoraphidium minutum]
MAIKVMSFNIRFDNPKEAEEDKWDARKPLCVEIINKYKPHIIGFQEPHRNQVDDLDAALPGYGWFGKGRYLTFMGINEEHNELNPIFYDKEALTLEASGTFWYSDTPEVPNTQWKCSAFPRIATWGRFAVNGTDQRMCFVNTHFDHESEEARTKAAELLLQQLPSISQNLPTAIVGDLNAGEGSPAVCHLCTELTECSGAGCETIEGLLGKVGTFVGFDKSIDSQIDFIFANKGFKASGYGTIPDERERPLLLRPPPHHGNAGLRRRLRPRRRAAAAGRGAGADARGPGRRAGGAKGGAGNRGGGGQGGQHARKPLQRAVTAGGQLFGRPGALSEARAAGGEAGNSDCPGKEAPPPPPAAPEQPRRARGRRRRRSRRSRRRRTRRPPCWGTSSKGCDRGWPVVRPTGGALRGVGRRRRQAQPRVLRRAQRRGGAARGGARAEPAGGAARRRGAAAQRPPCMLRCSVFCDISGMVQAGERARPPRPRDRPPAAAGVARLTHGPAAGRSARHRPCSLQAACRRVCGGTAL